MEKSTVESAVTTLREQINTALQGENVQRILKQLSIRCWIHLIFQYRKNNDRHDRR